MNSLQPPPGLAEGFKPNHRNMGTESVAVPGYEGLYSITRTGTITNARGRTISQRIDLRSGYITVGLTREGVTRTHYLHRLLASTFLENPNGLPVVNHLDGNRLNNRLDNLEWCTHAQNVKHAYDHGLIEGNRGGNQHMAVPVILLETGEVFTTIKEAASRANVNYNTFRNRLNVGKAGSFSKIDVSLN